MEAPILGVCRVAGGRTSTHQASHNFTSCRSSSPHESAYDLLPDQRHELVVDGYGAWSERMGKLATYFSSNRFFPLAAAKLAKHAPLSTMATNTYVTTACSADGSRLLAVGSVGIFASTDYGLTWLSNRTPTAVAWVACASSADGSKLVAAPNYALGGMKIYTRQSTPTPKLTLASSTRQLALSWVIPSTPFLLQENSSLAAANWKTVLAAPTLNLTNLQYSVTVRTTNAHIFYRLSTP